MAQLIQCIGRRRLTVSKQDGNILLRVMILDETNVLANLVLEPSEAARLVNALLELDPLFTEMFSKAVHSTKAKKTAARTRVRKPKV